MLLSERGDAFLGDPAAQDSPEQLVHSKAGPVLVGRLDPFHQREAVKSEERVFGLQLVVIQHMRQRSDVEAGFGEHRDLREQLSVRLVQSLDCEAEALFVVESRTHAEPCRALALAFEQALHGAAARAQVRSHRSQAQRVTTDELDDFGRRRRVVASGGRVLVEELRGFVRARALEANDIQLVQHESHRRGSIASANKNARLAYRVDKWLEDVALPLRVVEDQQGP